MNFKINLWTLLFIITAGALYYTNFVKKVNSPRPICAIHEDTGVIRADSAIGKIAAYKAYLDSIIVLDKSVPLITNANKPDFRIPQDSIPQENRKVEYFTIKKPCELGRILSESTDVNEVYACLSLEPNPEHKDGLEGMIDLIFKVKTNHPKGKYVDENGYKYYDFTSPCEPICGG